MDDFQAELQIQSAARTARIESMVEDMHDRLFGNGQPGLISVLDGRLKSLELFRSYVKGGFSLVTALLAFIGWPHIRGLFK